MKKLLIGLVFLVACLSIGSTVFADEFPSQTAIASMNISENAVQPSSCVIPTDGMKINQKLVLFCKGTYYIPNGIAINTSHLILDCNNSTLIGNLQLYPYNDGITVGYNKFTNKDSFSDVTIRNCYIDNFRIGIGVQDSSSINLMNNIIANVSVGIWFVDTYSSNIEKNNIVASTSPDIQLWGSSHNLITQNVLNEGLSISTSNYGSNLGNFIGNPSHDNKIFDNTFYGSSVYYSDPNDVKYNFFCSNNIGNTYLNGATGPSCPETTNSEQDVLIDKAIRESLASRGNKTVLDLFVMSFCPYGQQAENILWEVKQQLGEKIVVQPHFIVSIYDDTVLSLHGDYEAKEDMRQTCILYKYSENDWWKYVIYLDNNCNENNIDTCWHDAAKNAGIDTAVIESCVSEDGLSLLKYDEKLTQLYDVSGSPTLFINGNEYSGDRTPDAYMNAINETFLNERISLLESWQSTINAWKSTIDLWKSTIDSTIAWILSKLISIGVLNVTINSPLNQTYPTSSVRVDLSLSGKVNSLKMSTNGGSFTTLCTNCDHYNATRYFSTKKAYNVTLLAYDSAGNVLNSTSVIFTRI